jgi:hypothetical protein
MLQVEIGIFSFSYEPFYGFVMYLCQSSAPGAHHLHPHRSAGNQFVFGSGPASLTVMSPQNLCQNEQVERIIYRSHRDSFRLAGMYQLFGRKGLR